MEVDEAAVKKLMLYIASCQMTLGCCALMSNLFVVGIICRGKLWRKARFYLTLLFLAVAGVLYDIMQGLIAGPIRQSAVCTGLAYAVSVRADRSANVLWLGVMMMIAADRCYAVTAPIHYMNHSDKFISWGLAILTAVVVVATPASLIGTQNETPIPACTATLMTHRIFFVIYSICIFIMPGIQSVSCYIAVWTVSKFKKSPAVANRRDMDATLQRRHANITRLVTSIVTIYGLTSGVGLASAGATELMPDLNPLVNMAIVTFCGGVLVPINHILDVFVYAIRSEEMRAEIRRLCRCCFSCGSNAEVAPTITNDNPGLVSHGNKTSSGQPISCPQ